MDNVRIKDIKTEIRVQRVFGNHDFIDIYMQYAVNKYAYEIRDMLEQEPKQCLCSHIDFNNNTLERD